MHISTEHHAFWGIGGEALNKHPEQTKKGFLKALFLWLQVGLLIQFHRLLQTRQD
jgi:hypothetical protein